MLCNAIVAVRELLLHRMLFSIFYARTYVLGIMQLEDRRSLVNASCSGGSTSSLTRGVYCSENWPSLLSLPLVCLPRIFWNTVKVRLKLDAAVKMFGRPCFVSRVSFFTAVIGYQVPNIISREVKAVPFFLVQSVQKETPNEIVTQLSQFRHQLKLVRFLLRHICDCIPVTNVFFIILFPETQIWEELLTHNLVSIKRHSPF